MPLSFPSSFPSPSSHSYYAAERELTDVPGGKTRSPDAKSRLLATDAPTPCATITIIATAANTAAAADNSDGEPQQPPPTQAGLPVELEPLLVPVDYEIRYMDEKMPYKAKARSLGVARFPENDLSALVPADPPDKDCSHAKPPHQVPISTFMRYTEPYLRPISEEDMAFLRERGDPVTPYIVPKLGRYYLEQWADEDGANMPAGAGPSALASASSALATTAATATAAAVPPAAGTNSPAARPANAACGGPDDLCNENLDTENVSCGPLLSRLLACYLPEEPSDAADHDAAPGEASASPAGAQRTYATTLPNSADVNWSIPTGKADCSTLDERIRREMVYVGLLNPAERLVFDDTEDDEVSVRLRALQHQLHHQSIINGARKARIAEKLKEQLAYQEYTTVLEDFNKQVFTRFVFLGFLFIPPPDRKSVV